VLESFARHGKFDLQLKCTGDLHTGAHHSIEDCALVLGESLKIAAGNKRGIERFGFEKMSGEEILPMDESIAFLAADFSGRPFCKFVAKFTSEKVADFPTQMVAHFLQSFCIASGLNLHAKVEGENDHHQIEVLFKSLGRVLGKILQKTGKQIPSTKGQL
jgi:Imidazoleglycerol-phosphate dehydratase